MFNSHDCTEFKVKVYLQRKERTAASAHIYSTLQGGILSISTVLTSFSHSRFVQRTDSIAKRH